MPKKKIKETFKEIKNDSIREVLLKNKIYFEFINLLIFGLITILVGVKANNLLNVQNEINKINNLPNFHIISEAIKKGEIYANTKIDIFNYGGYANNVKIDSYSVLEKENFYELENTSEYLYIRNYFDTSFGGDGKELVRTLYGYENNLKFFNLYKEVIGLKDRDFNVEMDTYISVKYLDIYNEERIEYFLINIQGADKLDENEGKKIINKIKEYPKIFVDQLNIEVMNNLLN